ncbi:MAG: erythromycin esterase family protein [Armatimonadota bacterium]
MDIRDDAELVAEVRAIGRKLETPEDLDPLLDEIGPQRFVLLGEASHGTSEYYLWRARLSQRLIQERGFSFIAVEGDWPDCYQVNRYIQGYHDAGESARAVVHAFERWPTWMWANWEVVALAEWLRKHNSTATKRVGFYGLDVYSLWESMHAIIDYLEKNDPQAVPLAHEAFRCFEPYGENEQAYAWSTRMVPQTCEDEVVRLLQEMHRHTREYAGDAEAAFSAEQNALVMVDAERYYRAMVQSDRTSWNVRDQHMADTLDRLMDFYGPDAKGIVWAHNTHVGDARATDMTQAGMQNIGEIVRERHAGDGVLLIGFASHHGEVIAGKAWNAPMERMPVPDARGGSWEDILHRAGGNNKLLLLAGLHSETQFLLPRGQRAIGVVYNPEYERYGNYVPTILPNRYDALLYLDQTEALHPLHMLPAKPGLVPESYPWGM